MVPLAFYYLLFCVFDEWIVAVQIRIKEHFWFCYFYFLIFSRRTHRLMGPTF